MIVIDAGNTNIVIGFYTKNKLIKIIRLKTEKKINITKKEINKFFKSNKKLINNLKDRFCILSSVVPSLNLIFKNIFQKNKFKFYVINPKKISFRNSINYNLNQIGSDRIANYAYVYSKKIKNCIIVDFGTATTFDILKNGVYDGGVISPGIKLSIINLKRFTALLPLLNLKQIKKNYGKNTKDAMNTGFLWGYQGLINNIIKKILSNSKKNYKIILTGGYANFFKKYINYKTTIDKDITIKGLAIIFKKLL